MLFSWVVSAQLICVFVFAYAKIAFSHGRAHLQLCLSPQQRLSSELVDTQLISGHWVHIAFVMISTFFQVHMFESYIFLAYVEGGQGIS